MRKSFTISDLKNSACAGRNKHLFEDPEELRALKKAKYKNKKTEADGIIFDSKKERNRYLELKILLKAGKIGYLETQKVFLLIPKNEKERSVTYKADFYYIDAETGKPVVEDVKSEATRKLSTYIIKRKLMFEVHGIEIKEV